VFWGVILKSFSQEMQSLAPLRMQLFNDTRWDGRSKFLERCLVLEEHIVDCFKDHPKVEEIQRELCPDFLSSEYFSRLALYVPILKGMNSISLLYQSQKFPTGHLVPLCVYHMTQFLASNQYGEECFEDMKKSFLDAVGQYMVEPVLKNPNNFLKAACFHPGKYTCYI
jgi:hypothetical protein